MSDAKKVLVVDDHFEMLDFLRSMLELSSEDYEVLSAPSAEDGLAELGKADFDLLITDVRLPGMSGFDLVKRVKSTNPDIPIIMITAYSSKQGQKEASELGVYRYFKKPLDTDELLTSVHTALYGDLVVYADGPDVFPTIAPTAGDIVIPDDVSRRLATLRTDTGAARLTLATVAGELLLQVGSGRNLNFSRLISLMAHNLSNSFQLGKELGGDDPTTIQYHSGEEIDLYIANVGRDYFLAIFFDAQARRGRIGTVWVFAQRAIKDLLKMLPSLELASRSPADPSKAPTPSPAVESLKQPDLPEDALSKPEKPSPKEAAAPTLLSAIDEQSPPIEQPEPLAPTSADGFFILGEQGGEEDLDAFWGEPAEQDQAGSGAPKPDTLSFEEAQQQGFISFAQDLTAADSLPQNDDPLSSLAVPASGAANDGIDAAQLDEFWDSAISTDADEKINGKSLSFEEAQRQGLISLELPPEEPAASSLDAASKPADSKSASGDSSLLDDLSVDADVDLDTFWDTALEEESSEENEQTSGLSFEEAKRRGLFRDESAEHSPEG